MGTICVCDIGVDFMDMYIGSCCSYQLRALFSSRTKEPEVFNEAGGEQLSGIRLLTEDLVILDLPGGGQQHFRISGLNNFLDSTLLDPTTLVST